MNGAGLCVMGMALLAVLLSQVTPDGVAVLGPTGFICWYAWYLAARVVPRMERQFSDTLKAVVDLLCDELAECRERCIASSEDRES